MLCQVVSGRVRKPVELTVAAVAAASPDRVRLDGADRVVSGAELTRIGPRAATGRRCSSLMLLIDGARVAAGLGALPANAGLAPAPSDRATPAQSITVSVMKKKRR